MGFEWDIRKAAANLRKHAVDFADAVEAFSDELAVTVPEDYSKEERFITLGMDALGRDLVVRVIWEEMPRYGKKAGGKQPAAMRPEGVKRGRVTGFHRRNSGIKFRGWTLPLASQIRMAARMAPIAATNSV